MIDIQYKIKEIGKEKSGYRENLNSEGKITRNREPEWRKWENEGGASTRLKKKKIKIKAKGEKYKVEKVMREIEEEEQ